MVITHWVRLNSNKQVKLKEKTGKYEFFLIKDTDKYMYYHHTFKDKKLQ